jgi:hypothetical protein
MRRRRMNHRDLSLNQVDRDGRSGRTCDYKSVWKARRSRLDNEITLDFIARDASDTIIIVRSVMRHFGRRSGADFLVGKMNDCLLVESVKET